MRCVPCAKASAYHSVGVCLPFACLLMLNARFSAAVKICSVYVGYFLIALGYRHRRLPKAFPGHQLVPFSNRGDESISDPMDHISPKAFHSSLAMSALTLPYFNFIRLWSQHLYPWKDLAHFRDGW
jgi:hypothetical protein